MLASEMHKKKKVFGIERRETLMYHWTCGDNSRECFINELHSNCYIVAVLQPKKYVDDLDFII